MWWPACWASSMPAPAGGSSPPVPGTARPCATSGASGGSARARRPRPRPWPGRAPTRRRGSGTGRCAVLADTIAAQLSAVLGSVIDMIMTGIWVAAVGMLRGAFQLVDTFTTVEFVGVDTVTVGIDGAVRPLSPLGAVWPVLRGLSLAIAVGLFFVQLAATMLRGGRGVFRLVTGPFAYAVAVAMTAGGITLLFAAADGLTTVLLRQGLRADGFVGVLDSDAAQAVFSPAPTLDPVDPGRAARGAEATSQFDATARSVTLGVVALVGVIPASFGFALESVFRLAAFLVLVATSPISAAGLLSDATAGWYWRGLRWAVAAAVMKPALALVLVVGVNVLSAPTGVAGLIAGAGVLLVALFAPFTVYRLLAFVDPGTNAGAAARANFSRHSQRGRSDGGQGEPGAGDGEGGGGAEAAHAARFDAAGPGGAGGAGGGAGGGAAGSGVGAAGGGGAGAAGAAGGAAVAGVALVA